MEVSDASRDPLSCATSGLRGARLGTVASQPTPVSEGTMRGEAY
jgi:hypothetical protein